MVGNFGVHGANPADVVRNLAQVRYSSPTSILHYRHFEFEWRLHQLARRRSVLMSPPGSGWGMYFPAPAGSKHRSSKAASVHEQENHADARCG